MNENTQPRYFVQHVCTTNDHNGNPRRLFQVFDVQPDGYKLVAVMDEGYSGNDELRQRFGDVNYDEIDVTPAEYHRLLKRNI